MDAVGAGCEAEARGVVADLHLAGVVFGAVEDEDLAVANDGGRVEGVEGLPADGSFGDGVVEEGGFVGRDDGSVEGAGEGAYLPGVGRGFGCGEERDCEDGCAGEEGVADSHQEVSMP